VAASRRRSRRRGAAQEPDDGERWLLTYADMITLLMALFMVLFSISSVNTSKFDSLQRSLQDAFSGRILPGGRAVAQTGAQASTPELQAAPANPSLRPALTARVGTPAAARAEQRDLEQLRDQVRAYAASHGLAGKVTADVDERGLLIRLLTDRVLVDSGSARLRPEATPLIARLGGLLRTEGGHPIQVEGHTDDHAIRGGPYPTNWELSTARASAVVRELARDHVAPARMQAAGRAYLDPIATNATAPGRSRNRRVEIVLPRREGPPGTESTP